MITFKFAVPSSPEVRHFFGGMIALPGLAACAWLPSFQRRRSLAAALAIVAFGLGLNVSELFRIPSGLLGYGPLAERIVAAEKTGNVLLATWEDQDLIFRIRAGGPKFERYCIRADRTLAVRLSDYAKVDPQILATSEKEVIDLLEKGRIAYIVSCRPDGDIENRPFEMQLVDRTMRNRPDLVRSLGTFPLTVKYVEGAHKAMGGTIELWEVIAPVEPGPPQFSIPIPTAGMTVGP